MSLLTTTASLDASHVRGRGHVVRVILDNSVHPLLQIHPQLRGQLPIRSVVDVAVEPAGFVDPSHGSCSHSQLQMNTQYLAVVGLLLHVGVPHSLSPGERQKNL